MSIASSSGQERLQHELTHPAYRPDIDGLRALAVMLVVIYHAFPAWLPGGFIGVDIFFVISGYLISSIIFKSLANGQFSFADFYTRRIRRIFPALFLVLAACYALGWNTLPAPEYQQLGKHIAAGAAFVANFALWRESGYFDSDALSKPLLHLWSLGIEEQFYIVWPLLLWAVWRLPGKRLMALTVFALAVSFAGNLWSIERDLVAAFYSPLSRFWELLAGAVLAGIAIRQGARFAAADQPQANLRSLAGAGLLLLGVCLISDGDRFPGWWALLPTGGAVLLIAAGPGAWLNRHLLSARPVVWIGLISFPLYLWHWPLLSFLRSTVSPEPANGLLFAAVLLAIILAGLTYYLVERPIRTSRHGRRLAGALLVLVALIGFLGYNAYVRAGLQFRSIAKATELPAYDWRAGYRYGRCFLSGESGSSPIFAEECAAADGTDRPLVMVWGDSHSASLYPGIAALAAEQGYRVAQYSTSGCPPVLDFAVDNRPECVRMNAETFARIPALQPELVLLAGHWSIYDGKEGWSLLGDEQLAATIDRLKAAGVRHVVLVGHLPTFKGGKPSIARNFFIAGKADRSLVGFNTWIRPHDERIRALAKRSGVGYFSPLELLCNEQGCLISTEPDRFVPLAWDSSHLTADGALLLVRKAVAAGLLPLGKAP